MLFSFNNDCIYDYYNWYLKKTYIGIFMILIIWVDGYFKLKVKKHIKYTPTNNQIRKPY